MIPQKEFAKEYERIKKQVCTLNFECANNNSGICMWQKHSGCECISECERYKKCFTCKSLGRCEKEIEIMLCEHFERRSCK